MKQRLALVGRRRLQRVRHSVTKVQLVPFTLFVQVGIDDGVIVLDSYALRHQIQLRLFDARYGK